MTPSKLKNNGGLNSITFSNFCSLKRKTYFLDFWAIFVSPLPSTIMISQKNPFAQQFVYLKALIWHRKHYVLRFINQPYLPINPKVKDPAGRCKMLSRWTGLPCRAKLPLRYYSKHKIVLGI